MNSLFQSGAFRLHSGALSDFKIDCDALTDADIDALAKELHKRVEPFGIVLGVPTGGMRIAKALEPFRTVGHHNILIVDDVFTTGNSIKEFAANFAQPLKYLNYAVLFSRGPCDGVTALFQMHEKGKV